MEVKLTRKKINKEIELRKNKIQALKDEIIEFTKQGLLLCDSKQRFEEKEEVWTIKKRPKITETVLAGRIYWREGFRDEDTGKIIYIERSRLVRQNGEWL